MFHGVSVKPDQRRYVFVGFAFEPFVERTVGDFLQCVFVELNVGLPFWNVVKFSTFLLAFDGGLSVRVALLEKRCDG